MRETRTRNLVLAGLMAALTALGAFIRIPLGITSITLQFFFTAMAGVLLGPKWGALSQGAYVALGLAGLPVFTLGGGLSYVFQPGFGFLLGLLPAAPVTGALSRGRASRPGWVALACLAGLGALYLIAVPYMYLILNLYLGRGMPVWEVIRTGMLLYLPGDGVKIGVTCLVSRPLARALKRG